MSKQEVSKRSSAWVRLRKRLNRKGVVDVDVDHHRYELLNMLRSGIRDLMLNHKELGPKKELTQEDYHHTFVKEIETSGGKKFKFTSYSSSVFASIRQAVSVSEDQYLNTIAPPELPYMEFMSNSRSGQDFYLSNDQQYILKTDKKHNIDIFQSFLLEYLDHFQTYPHSLIVKFLGIYVIDGPGCPRTHFLAMQNIFYPPQRIETRFDIKGCLKNRYQKPYPPDSNILTILKDQNFLEESIDLGVQKKWFIRQLKIDVEFLRQIGVQDYSLLIGQHKIQDTEAQKTMGDLVIRVKKSTVSSHNTLDTKMDSSIVTDKVANERKGSIPGEVEEPVNTGYQSENVLKVHKRIYTVPDFLKDPEKGEMSNRRLLLNCRNPLHVINGAEKRYYLGIVDFFTKYECRQQLGRIIKTLKYLSFDHSTVPPDIYSERFLKFITERTTDS